MRARYFHGWNVGGATFVMASFSFGLGFYGLTVYVAMLQRFHGWSASVVSAPVTVYYVAGALLTTSIASLYERLGPRAVVAGGSVAMAAGVAALGIVAQPWQLYAAFLVMAVGWGAMSGSAINIILAPWFLRRRGLAVSIAFNGATLGGVIVAPALIPLIDALGFPRALAAAAALVLLAVLLTVAVGVMRRGPEELGLGPDGDPCSPAAGKPVGGEPRGRGDALRTWRFWSVSAPFALGLAAQVGVLTHLVALVTPTLGTGGAARAVSTTTAAAVLGRLLTGFVIDRLNRRLVASATLVIQITGLALLAWAPSVVGGYAGCALFGLGVGNLTTLPGLILAVEWPRERFSALLGLVVGIIAVEVPVGEQPRRSREEQDVAAGAHERSHRRLDAARDEPPGIEGFLGALARLLEPPEREAFFRCGALDLVQQVVDGLVAGRGDADAAAAADQLDGDPRPRPGLARPRRSLDEEIAAVERCGQVAQLAGGRRLDRVAPR